MLSFSQYLLEIASIGSTTDLSSSTKKNNRDVINRSIGLSGETIEKMQPYIGKIAKPSTFISDYDEFVSAFPSVSMAIDKIRPGSQVGPGEMVFYYIFDNIGVGGNQNIDLFLDGKPFAEVKGGIKTANGKAVYGFEMGSNANGAANKLINDLKAINDAYEEENNEPLPGWRGADSIKITDLDKWRKLEISSASGIQLSLKTNGDLIKKGNKKPVLNVKSVDSLAPIKKLLDEPVEPSGVKTIAQAISDWAMSIMKSYADGKTFVFVDRKNLKPLYFGEITEDMIDIKRITRAKPEVIIYFDGRPQEPEDETEEETKE